MIFMLKGYTVNPKNKAPSIQITEQLLQSSSAIKKKKRSLEDVKSWKTGYFIGTVIKGNYCNQVKVMEKSFKKCARIVNAPS